MFIYRYYYSTEVDFFSLCFLCVLFYVKILFFCISFNENISYLFLGLLSVILHWLIYINFLIVLYNMNKQIMLLTIFCFKRIICQYVCSIWHCNFKNAINIATNTFLYIKKSLICFTKVYILDIKKLCWFFFIYLVKVDKSLKRNGT